MNTRSHKDQMEFLTLHLRHSWAFIHECNFSRTIHYIYPMCSKLLCHFSIFLKIWWTNFLINLVQHAWAIISNSKNGTHGQILKFLVKNGWNRLSNWELQLLLRRRLLFRALLITALEGATNHQDTPSKCSKTLKHTFPFLSLFVPN